MVGSIMGRTHRRAKSVTRTGSPGTLVGRTKVRIPQPKVRNTVVKLAMSWRRGL